MLTEHIGEKNPAEPAEFDEKAGRGLQAKVEGKTIRIGSRSWVGAVAEAEDTTASRVYVAIDGHVLGYYRLANRFRDGLEKVLAALKNRLSLSLLTGDRDTERDRVEKLFGPKAEIRFRQSPHDKLAFVKEKLTRGENVLMIGDGLNDAGALKAASVGISIAEENSAFSPACDGILQAGSFSLLPRIMDMARSSLGVIKASFALSLLYNVVGLGFAVTGKLSPVIAAILMPASSVTVVLFATLMTTLVARRKGLV
jgi:Cu+-exporting ATPase